MVRRASPSTRRRLRTGCLLPTSSTSLRCASQYQTSTHPPCAVHTEPSTFCETALNHSRRLRFVTFSCRLLTAFMLRFRLGQSAALVSRWLDRYYAQFKYTPEINTVSQLLARPSGVERSSAPIRHCKTIDTGSGRAGPGRFACLLWCVAVACTLTMPVWPTVQALHGRALAKAQG